jgi:hypothetical protein
MRETLVRGYLCQKKNADGRCLSKGKEKILSFFSDIQDGGKNVRLFLQKTGFYKSGVFHVAIVNQNLAKINLRTNSERSDRNKRHLAQRELKKK